MKKRIGYAEEEYEFETRKESGVWSSNLRGRSFFGNSTEDRSSNQVQRDEYYLIMNTITYSLDSLSSQKTFSQTHPFAISTQLFQSRPLRSSSRSFLFRTRDTFTASSHFRPLYHNPQIEFSSNRPLPSFPVRRFLRERGSSFFRLRIIFDSSSPSPASPLLLQTLHRIDSSPSRSTSNFDSAHSLLLFSPFPVQPRFIDRTILPSHKISYHSSLQSSTSRPNLLNSVIPDDLPQPISSLLKSFQTSPFTSPILLSSFQVVTPSHPFLNSSDPGFFPLFSIPNKLSLSSPLRLFNLDLSFKSYFDIQTSLSQEYSSLGKYDLSSSSSNEKVSPSSPSSSLKFFRYRGYSFD